MITVFFDGKCGLCFKEISYYRKIAPDEIFIWQDITKSADDLKANGISLSKGLKLLHVENKPSSKLLTAQAVAKVRYFFDEFNVLEGCQKIT